MEEGAVGHGARGHTVERRAVEHVEEAVLRGDEGRSECGVDGAVAERQRGFARQVEGQVAHADDEGEEGEQPAEEGEGGAAGERADAHVEACQGPESGGGAAGQGEERGRHHRVGEERPRRAEVEGEWRGEGSVAAEEAGAGCDEAEMGRTGQEPSVLVVRAQQLQVSWAHNLRAWAQFDGKTVHRRRLWEQYAFP